MSNPVLIDLERSLLRSDPRCEQRVQALIQRPWRWFEAGSAPSVPDPASMAWDEQALEGLRALHAQGRPLILMSRQGAGLTARVAEHLQIFHTVHEISSEEQARSLAAAYAADGAEWLALPTARVPAWRVWPRALRLHQWLKNLLIFLPLLAAHHGGADAWLQAVLAFLAFGLCASAVYVFNDLLDLEADRQHPRKRLRPFAAGQLPAHQGLAGASLLLLSAALVASALPWRFGLVLALYALMTSMYSLGLKRLAILDVLWLAALYTLRVVAGGAATGISPSTWLLCFSMFTFLSLACLKRYTELIDLRLHAGRRACGRGYLTEDLHLIAVQGNAAGYLAVLVLILYINSRDVSLLYPQAHWLWGISVALLFWFNRSWWLAHRGRMHDDPIVYAARDRVSQAVLAVCMTSAILASWSI